MTREELIERARAFLALPRGAGYLCDFELIDNFVSPLLAQERRAAIEECARMCEEVWIEDTPMNGYAVRKHFADSIRALARGEGQAETLEAEPSNRYQERIRALRQPAALASEPERRHGHSKLVWNKEKQEMETLDPYPEQRAAREEGGMETSMDKVARLDAEKKAACAHEFRRGTGDLSDTVWCRRCGAYPPEKLRPPRPEQEADVFEQVALEWWHHPDTDIDGYGGEVREQLAALLRERFGPVAKALDECRSRSSEPGIVRIASAALSRLRATGGGG